MKNDDVMTAVDQKKLLFQLPELYSPSYPISRAELFAGRVVELKGIARATATRGQHPIIFGGRGVGKTSLANLVKDQLISQGYHVVKITCVSGDTFHSAWNRAFSEMVIREELETPGEATPHVVEDVLFVRHAPSKIGPADVRKVTQIAPSDAKLVFIFDEFDAIHTSADRHLFAHTIKDLGDNCENVTLILVGVGHNVDELIKEHASIDRNLKEVKVPPMDADELREIIDKACRNLGMTIDATVLDIVIFLSQGLPHYTHLLGQECTTSAIERRSYHIESKDLQKGIVEAINGSHHSVTTAYQNATASPKKNNLFAVVLLACALSQTDDFGYFAAADVRVSLNKITKKDYDIPNFSQHLDKFSTDVTRGPVLEKKGTKRRFRFKFINPMLQPFVIMRGLASGMIAGEFVKSLAKTMPKKRSDTTGELFAGFKI